MCSTIVLVRSFTYTKDYIFKPVVNFVMKSRNSLSFALRLTIFGLYTVALSGATVGGLVTGLVKLNRKLNAVFPNMEISDYSFITLGLSTLACLEGVFEYIGKIIHEWHPNAFPGVARKVARHFLMFVFGMMIIPAIAGVCLEKVLSYLYTYFVLNQSNPNPNVITMSCIPNVLEVNKIGSVFTFYLIFCKDIEGINEQEDNNNNNQNQNQAEEEAARNGLRKYMAQFKFWFRIYSFSVVISRILVHVFGEVVGRKISEHVWFWMFVVSFLVKVLKSAVSCIKKYHNSIRDKKYASVHLSNYDEAENNEENDNNGNEIEIENNENNNNEGINDDDNENNINEDDLIDEEYHDYDEGTIVDEYNDEIN